MHSCRTTSLKKKPIILIGILAVLMSAYFVEPALRRVPVDAMVAVPPATSLTVRVFEEGPDPVATLQVDSASPSLTAIRAIIQDGQPEWNWFGRKLKLDDPSFCIDMVAEGRRVRISGTGHVCITHADGRKQYVRTPRSKRMYDRLATVVREASAP